MDRVAIVITNYNMPERTDALCQCITERVGWPHNLIVVDNGSDLVKPSRYSNVFLKENLQTTGGWLAGLHYADVISEAYGEPFFAYWFLITSAEFPPYQRSDPLEPLVEALLNIPDAVGVHPALTPDSTTAWQHLKKREGVQPRKTWMIDNIASLYRADWFNSIGRFDPELVYGWGIDYETCYKARSQGKGLYVHEGVQIKKVTDIGYSMGRMNMTSEERREKAASNTVNVLYKKYGPDWEKLMREEYITREMV